MSAAICGIFVNKTPDVATLIRSTLAVSRFRHYADRVATLANAL